MFLSLALIPGPKYLSLAVVSGSGYVSLVLVSGPKCVSLTDSGFGVKVCFFHWLWVQGQGGCL